MVDPYDARDRLIQYHVDHVMSLRDLRTYVVEDLFSVVHDCPDTLDHLLENTGISAEDQAAIRKEYTLVEEVSGE